MYIAPGVSFKDIFGACVLMSEPDVEEEALNSPAHFIAGALAGTAEHTGMFPVDTIKVSKIKTIK